MGSDLYDVKVERFRTGSVDEQVRSAAALGLDAASVREILCRMGTGERAVAVDLYIRQIHCDAPIAWVEHAFMAMVLHSAGYASDKLYELQERIASHFGGFDNINNTEFAYGPEAACFAFSLLERGKVAGDPRAYRHEPEGFEIPDDDWVRVRVFMAWELGRELQRRRWSSRAWVPGQHTIWNDHMPAAGLPQLEPPRELEPELQLVCGLAMAKGRLFAIGEDDPEVVCHEATGTDYLWRSERLQGNSPAGYAVTVSADGERLYVSGGDGWAARARVDGDGESVERLPCGADGPFTLAEDSEGRLFEIRYSEEAGPGGMIWERDRTTGERNREVVSLQTGDAWPRLREHVLARRAPVGAAATDDHIVVWDRGELRQRWALSGDGSVHALALSEPGDTLYILRRHDDKCRLEAWKTKSCERLWSAPLPFERSSGEGLVTLPGGRHLAVSCAGRVGLFDLTLRSLVWVQPASPARPRGFLHALGVSAEGDALYVSVDQRVVLLWPLRELLGKGLKPPAHEPPKRNRKMT